MAARSTSTRGRTARGRMSFATPVLFSAPMPTAPALFPDVNPVTGMGRVNALQFLDRGIPRFEYQRPINPDRVEQILREQIGAHELVFATPIILVHVNGRYVLCDGQHRLEAIRRLRANRYPGIDALEIMVVTHVCRNQAEADRIYLQVNDQYMHNGAIDREAGVIFRATHEISDDVTTRMERLYPNQIGTNFPYFDPNCLKTELNRYLSSNQDRRLTAEQIIDIFRRENERYGPILIDKNATWYARGMEKGGFFLPAMEAKCRWVSAVLARY